MENIVSPPKTRKGLKRTNSKRSCTLKCCGPSNKKQLLDHTNESERYEKKRPHILRSCQNKNKKKIPLKTTHINDEKKDSDSDDQLNVDTENIDSMMDSNKQLKRTHGQRSCALKSCMNYERSEEVYKNGISFHRFPTETAARKKWIEFTKRTDITFQCAYLCSDHFQPDDFDRDLRSELLYNISRNLLKKGAIPSIYVKKKESKNQKEEMELKERRKYIEAILKPTLTPKEIARRKLEKEKNLIPVPSSTLIELEDLRESYRKLEIVAAKLRGEIVMLKTDINKFKKRENTVTQEVYSDVFTKLRHVFTQNQLKILLGKQKKVRWNEEEINIALTLHSMSKECYLYLKNHLNYPLPAVTNVRKCETPDKITIEMPGAILNILKNYSQLKQEVATDTGEKIDEQFDNQYGNEIGDTEEHDQSMIEHFENLNDIVSVIKVEPEEIEYM